MAPPPPLRHTRGILLPSLLIILCCYSAMAHATPPPPRAPPSVAPLHAAAAATRATDMRAILRKVGSLPCPASVRSRMFALLYDRNVALHDTCISDSSYQFFPYTGKLPSTEQILAIVTSTACMQLYTGAVLAKFQECDVDFVSVRSAAEVFLRVKQDRKPITQSQFYELYNLNRVVNLLNENASQIDAVFREDSAESAQVSLSEMTRLMAPLVLSPGVALNDDMSLTLNSDDTEDKPQPSETTKNKNKNTTKTTHSGSEPEDVDSTDGSGSSGSTTGTWSEIVEETETKSSRSGSSSRSSSGDQKTNKSTTSTETETSGPGISVRYRRDGASRTYLYLLLAALPVVVL